MMGARGDVRDPERPRGDAAGLSICASLSILAAGMFVCGDHRDTASIQGAIVSGRRTAQAVARALA